MHGRAPISTLVVGSVAAFLLAAMPALAFVSSSNPAGQTRHWPSLDPGLVTSTNVINPSTEAVRFYLAGDAYSKTNAPAELNALRAAFDQWQSVPGTSLRFEEAGLVLGGADINSSDASNVVFWAKTSTLVNGGFDDISGALSVTFPRVNSDNMILESDIVLNGVQFRWFADAGATDQTDQFIEATMLHEIGHFIGLDHSPVGGATMLARGAGGVNTQAGLSSDEIAAARSLYPMAEPLRELGFIRGRVVMNGTGVFGASVIVEDDRGNVVSGTVAGPDGRFELPALAAGRYELRVSPLDPLTSAPLARLVSGLDIAPAYAGVETGFLTSPPREVSVVARATNAVTLAVVKGSPLFRIARIRPAASASDEPVAINSPAAIRVGTGNLVVGVYSPDFPASGAVLRITGDGLALGASGFIPDVFPGSRPALHLLALSIDVASNATPGLRSFVVQHGTNIAYANGFLEITPAIADDNFDGLDDAFQRRHFPLFTSAAAAPEADPDADGSANAAEHSAGTDPTNRASVLRIEHVKRTPNGADVAWQSVPGRRYELFYMEKLGFSEWTPIGGSVTATGARAQLLDVSATNDLRFYRVCVWP